MQGCCYCIQSLSRDAEAAAAAAAARRGFGMCVVQCHTHALPAAAAPSPLRTSNHDSLTRTLGFGRVGIESLKVRESSIKTRHELLGGGLVLCRPVPACPAASGAENLL